MHSVVLEILDTNKIKKIIKQSKKLLNNKITITILTTHLKYYRENAQ